MLGTTACDMDWNEMKMKPKNANVKVWIFVVQTNDKTKTMHTQDKHNLLCTLLFENCLRSDCNCIKLLVTITLP